MQMIAEHPDFARRIIAPLKRLDWYFANNLLKDAKRVTDAIQSASCAPSTGALMDLRLPETLPRNFAALATLLVRMAQADQWNAIAG